MKFTIATALALGALLLSVMPLSAHHALQAQFDVNKTIELKGTLERVEWVNPHAYLYLGVKDEKSGATKRWGWETIGPQALRRAGFTRGPASFTIGETYTFVGFAALDGSDKAFTTAVLFPDGRKITLWFGDPFAK
jgi:hypothetical protein